MQKQTQTTITPATVLLASLATIGATLLDEAGDCFPGYPAIARVVVEFDGYRGGGDLLAIDLYPPGRDTRPIHPEIAAALLDEPLPDAPVGSVKTIGRALDEVVLGLLNLRHPKWTEGEGTSGEIDLAWKPVPDGTPTVVIAGTLETRSVVTKEHPFWLGKKSGYASAKGKKTALACA